MSVPLKSPEEVAKAIDHRNCECDPDDPRLPRLCHFHKTVASAMRDYANEAARDALERASHHAAEVIRALPVPFPEPPEPARPEEPHSRKP